MLPATLWRPWEPRVVFPIFCDARNTLDYAVQDSFSSPLTLRALLYPAYHFYRKRKDLLWALKDYQHLLVKAPMRFRLAFLSRKGELLAQWTLPERYGPGDFFSVDLNDVLGKLGVPHTDGLVIVIASRGGSDFFNATSGNVSIHYMKNGCTWGYRTGCFARTLNPSKGKKHFGYTGINPKVIASDAYDSSIFLINHSSDPLYDRGVSPTIRLYRNQTEYLETSFGEIAPHGGLERSVSELFPEARNFLAAAGGIGCTVTRATGATLASLHLLKSVDGRTVGMDHSRPSHANVVAYYR